MGGELRDELEPKSTRRPLAAAILFSEAFCLCVIVVRNRALLYNDKEQQKTRTELIIYPDPPVIKRVSPLPSPSSSSSGPKPPASHPPYPSTPYPSPYVTTSTNRYTRSHHPPNSFLFSARKPCLVLVSSLLPRKQEKSKSGMSSTNIRQSNPQSIEPAFKNRSTDIVSTVRRANRSKPNASVSSLSPLPVPAPKRALLPS